MSRLYRHRHRALRHRQHPGQDRAHGSGGARSARRLESTEAAHSPRGSGAHGAVAVPSGNREHHGAESADRRRRQRLMRGKPKLAIVEPARTDLETRVTADHHDSLRIWLRLLACTHLIENRVRQHLQAQFATTLPRFDLMAQLERAPDGLKMNELSRRMMVTGGNVTGITDLLE